MKSLLQIAWLIGAGTLVFPVTSSQAVQPAVTAEQIEADWDRQVELREAQEAGLSVAQDAAGGCDGIKTGKWGFHTQNEEQPWWQVDLGKSLTLDRIALFNRCDGGFARRNARIIVLTSDDGKEFKQAYQHDGSIFLV